MVRPSSASVERRRRFWERLEGALRRGPLRAEAFSESRLHGRRPAAILGIALGVTFTICFATGFTSHLIQHPPDWSWWSWPSRPAGLYRVTQGVHVATGIATIPLLLAKLFVVYPKFWIWPPVRDVTHAVERLALLPLVGGSLMLLATGVANIAGWYPWPFFFIQGHYAAAWVTVGALIIHVGAKIPAVLDGLREQGDDRLLEAGTLTRRGLLSATFGTAGLLTLLTVGQTFEPLRRLALLAPRDPVVGPQGIPINKTAERAQVRDAARSEDYRLVVRGDVAQPLSFTRSDLDDLPHHEATLPIACVEGWSASGVWRGVRVRDLLEMAGAPEDVEVKVVSLEQRGPYNRSLLEGDHVHDPDTFLATGLNGERLAMDHGFPMRLIAPNRPGVMQTKWVTALEVRRTV